MDSKTCTKCRVEKSVEEFTPRRNRAPGAREAMCKECVREKSRRWYRDNREHVLERTSEYQAANRDRSRQYVAKWNAANREHRRAYAEAYRAADPERRKRQDAEFRGRHPDKNRRDAQRRRAMLAGVEHDPQVTVDSLRERDGGLCGYCGAGLNFDQESDQYLPERATIEHITPVSRGGSHTFDNTAIVCRRCNVSKGSKTFVWEWIPAANEGASA